MIAILLASVRPSHSSALTSWRPESSTFTPGSPLRGAFGSTSHPALTKEKDLQVWFVVESILYTCAFYLHNVAAGYDVQLI